MKNILVTGARSGIIADVIYEIRNRYNIYLTVHTDSELEIVNKMYKNYDNIKCYKFDLLDKNDILKYGNFDIDILICNSSIMESGSLLDLPFENIRNCFEVNFFSNLFFIKNVVKNNNKVKVIVMSSLGSIVPMPFCGVYSASKAALRQIMLAFSKEIKLLSNKINIVIIEPGLYNTGFNEYGFSKKYKYMSKNTSFFNHVDFIKKIERIILKLFEKKNYRSIVFKIVKAIDTKNPKLFYRAPIFQTIFVKIYNLFS